jgi:hypothetical protein
MDKATTMGQRDTPDVLLHDNGRVKSVSVGTGRAVDVVDQLNQTFGLLLCADLTVLGARTLATHTAHLALVAVKERTVSAIDFWAGSALRDGHDHALRDALCDALLTRWHGSFLAGGVARLVADRTCRAAIVHDDTGTRTFGTAGEIPPLTGRHDILEPGARLAVRTPDGDFRGISFGSATVLLSVTPGWDTARRVEDWFDRLEAAMT